MRNIESCFFCATPYQIIAAIAIVRQSGESADLYVINQFASAGEYVERIKEEKIFSEVKLIKFTSCSSKNKIIIWSQVIIQYLHIEQIVRETLVPETNYKKIYASARNSTFRCVWIYLSKNNPLLKRVNYDDGVGSYTSELFVTLFRKGDLFIQRILFRNKGVNTPADCQMLFSPELYYRIHGLTERNIVKIECDFKNEKTMGIYNRIFQYQSNYNINERIILLDCMKNEGLNQQEKEALSLAYREIFARCGAEKIIVKRHPRDREEKVDGINYCLDNQIPFECVCMNMDCSTKVLISLSSTAVATPKLLLNQEPYVILLYKLVLENRLTNEKLSQIDKFFHTLKEDYVQSNRFFIPKNMSDLKATIDNILKQ